MHRRVQTWQGKQKSAKSGKSHYIRTQFPTAVGTMRVTTPKGRQSVEAEIRIIPQPNQTLRLEVTRALKRNQDTTIHIIRSMRIARNKRSISLSGSGSMHSLVTQLQKKPCGMLLCTRIGIIDRGFMLYDRNAITGRRGSLAIEPTKLNGGSTLSREAAEMPDNDAVLC